MVFTSFEFTIFLPIVFIGYWLLKNNLKLQNLLLLVASYVFYGWWDYRFLGLIIFSSVTDYFVGLLLYHEKRTSYRKLYLCISILVNIGLLGFFKYYNFFLDSFVSTFSVFGMKFNINRLNIILPVGISFYTFQTLSYIIDVYRGKMNPTRNIITFMAYVSFFPQLVAGPIERAINLLPQFEKEKKFDLDLARDGLRQILWGTLKKVLVADNLARIVENIFSNYSHLSGSVLLLGAIYFGFQIYCDFSGYSDIAVGTAKLFNIRIMKNFDLPYFSQNFKEFWRRWHISLSTWFRDYVYISLGGNKVSERRKIFNVLVTFVVSGLWHGANLKFLIWGFLNGCFLVISSYTTLFINKIASLFRIFPRLYKKFDQVLFLKFVQLIHVATTFFIIMLLWVFFRAGSLHDALSYLARMFTHHFFSLPEKYKSNILIIITLLIFEYLLFFKNLNFTFKKLPLIVRWSTYLFFVLIILIFGELGGREFIYFQF